MCLSLDQWLWSGEWDIMIGQSLSHMFKPVVRRGGSAERGVLHRQVTPTAISLFSVGRGSVLSPAALGLPVGRRQYPFHWNSWERVWSSRSVLRHTYNLGVSMPEPEPRSVNVWTVSWYHECSKIYIPSIFITSQKKIPVKQYASSQKSIFSLCCVQVIAFNHKPKLSRKGKANISVLCFK